MCDPFEPLGDQTFVLERNVNCPSPYLIRLIGTGGIDKLPPGETKDVLGYGKTLEEAVATALANQITNRYKRVA